MNRRSLIDNLEPRLCLHGDFDVTFNFQPRTSAVPAGTIADLGYAFGDRGGGMNYGWNVDNRGNMRDRNLVSDQKLDTLAQMQAGGNFSWELEIPNGQYEVTIGSGDAKYLDGQHHITAEGTLVMYGVQSKKKQFLKATRIITVNDGRLTLAPDSTGVNTKIQYVRVASYHDPATLPTVTITAPVPNAAEGGANGSFRITRSLVTSSPLTVSVAWSGSGGTTRDVVSVPTEVVIPANAASVDLPVVAVDDSLNESLETAKVTIVADADAYNVGSPATASVFIDGSEPPPVPTLPSVSVDVTDNSATEGGNTAAVRFTRTGDGLASPLTINLTWSGSAGASDIAARPSTATFPANVSSFTLTITAVDDALVEATETSTVSIDSSSDYNVTGGSASVSILDNDVAPPPDSFSNISWSAATAPPISFSETTSEVVNGKLYLFGGFNSVFVPQSKVYRFDGTTWSTMNDAPVAFTHVGHAEVDGKMWIAGGYIGNGSGGQIFGTTAVRIYDPATDTWADGPALPQARAAGNLAKIGRTLYYFGGENFNRTTNTPDMWALDLDNQSGGWVTKTSMPMARTHTAAVVVDGKIIALGGQTGYDENLTAHNEIQIYDPATNAWSIASHTLPAASSHAWQSTFYYRGRIIMVGGETAHNMPVNSVWSIDPDTFVTTSLGAFPDARFSAAGGILNDKVYIFGGYEGFIPSTSYVGTFAM